MHLRLQSAVWMCVIMYSTCNFTVVDWAILLPDLGHVCSENEFCGKIPANSQDVIRQKNSCCQGCSCNDNCFENGNCCFENQQVDPYTACLQPITKPFSNFVKYKFVIGQPSEGCRNKESTETNGAGTQDVNVTEMGDFLPVYSKKLDVNFKNRALAICHGAVDSTDDIKAWKTLLNFHLPSDLFISSLTNFYDSGFQQSGDVDLVFDPPTEESRAVNKRCFDVIDNCQIIFMIPEGISLAREDIIKACETGPRSLYIEREQRVYKNPFCAICNNRGKGDNIRCGHAPPQDSKTVSTFRAFIKTGVIKEIKESMVGKKRTTPARNVCKQYLLNETRCVYLNCPALKIRFPNGDCDFPADVIDETAVFITLILSPIPQDNNNTTYFNNLTEAVNVAIQLEEFKPWSSDWKISESFSRVNEAEILVKLISNTINDLRKLNNDVSVALSKLWTINDETKIQFKQTISNHGAIIGDRFQGSLMTPVWQKYLGSNDYSIEVPIWRNILPVQTRRNRFQLHITKMFFCEQVELSPDEYTFYSTSAPLVMTDNSTILLPDEYTVLQEYYEGPIKVRVCLKDSGYKSVLSSGCTKYKCNVLWQSLTIIFVVRGVARVYRVCT